MRCRCLQVLDVLGKLAPLSCVHEYEKTYWVMIEGEPTPEKLTQLERGIHLQNYVTLPCRLRLIPAPDLSPRPKPVTPHGPTA